MLITLARGPELAGVSAVCLCSLVVQCARAVCSVPVQCCSVPVQSAMCLWCACAVWLCSVPVQSAMEVGPVSGSTARVQIRGEQTENDDETLDLVDNHRMAMY